MSRLCSLFVVIACLLMPSLATAQDQVIYDDALQNSWENWSWATVNLSNKNPKQGSASIKVTAGAWEALYLHHTAFDTSAYTSLSFWVHGGSTGGQTAQVSGLLSDTQQTPVHIGPFAANTWQHIEIPLSQLGVANTSNCTAFWIQDNTGAGQATFYVDTISLIAAPVPSSVNVAVNAGSTLRTVDNRHFGLNTATWDSVMDSPTTLNLLTAAGVRTLRFPGGSRSDDYNWQTGQSNSDHITWPITFDEFAGVASGIGASDVFITANYGSGTPEEAAAWVQYSNVTKGYGFKYWEIGNEIYGAWEIDNNTRPHDPVTYANRFQQYYTQMKAVDPTIKIGAVVVAGEDSYANYTDQAVTNPRTGQQHSGWTPVLLTTLKNLGVTPDYVVYHYYPQNPGNEGDAALLASTTNWANDAAALRQHISDYLGAAGAGVELVCTENNSVSSLPGKQTTSLVTGLYLADSFCQLMQTEFKAMVWWDLRNGQETRNNNSTSLYGWRLYGDYGLVNSDVPADPADFYPTYYVLKQLQYFARGGDSIISATSDYTGLSAYAARKPSNGPVSILLVNKHPTANLTASISLANYTPPSTATVYTYGKVQDTAAQTGNGSADIAQTTLAVSGSSFNYTTAPYSVTVISFSPPPPPPATPPSAPSNLAGTAVNKNQVNLTWTDNSANEDGFRVDYSVQYDFSSGVTTLSTGANATGMSVTNLNPSTNYYFRVRAFNANGESANSASINVRTPRR